MSSDTQVLFGAKSKPAPVPFRGGFLHPRHICQREKTMWVESLKAQAKRDLALERNEISSEEYEQRREQLQWRFDHGHFGFLTPLSLDRLKTPDGMLKMMSIVFDISEDDAIFVMSESPEAMEAFSSVLADSFPASDKAPKPTMPGSETEAKNA